MGAMCWIRKALVQRAHRVVHAPLPATGHSRIGNPDAPVTKLVDVPDSDSGFWEFDSPLGHHPHHLLRALRRVDLLARRALRGQGGSRPCVDPPERFELPP